MNRMGPNQLNPDGDCTIVFWAAHGAIFQGLVNAMKVYLPHCEVRLISALQSAEEPDNQVGLVLVDLASHNDFISQVAECRRQYPQAALGVVLNDATSKSRELDQLFNDRQIQGFLPLDIKLEVWLAAISLLVNGGDYYPTSMSRQTIMFDNDGAGQEPLSQPAAAVAANASGVVSNLTTRERQVLALLSQGYQNKLIADRMALSEHTVKVHVHNLITKLRVSNRTQAAAAFRSYGHFTPPHRMDISRIEALPERL